MNARLAQYRFAAAALAVSAALHAAVIVGLPRIFDEPLPQKQPASFDAELAPAAVALEPERAPAPRASPRAARPRPRRAIVAMRRETFTPVAQFDDRVPLPEVLPSPDLVALAEPIAPAFSLPPEFPRDALPGKLRIKYELTSAFADGQAVYTWEREGDRYTITGEAEAVGFFTLFLQGRILQESRGLVTALGLRPERFIERRPNAGEEGLSFDWKHRKVTFERENGTRTEDLRDDSTVDWLSMIFQLAHAPPKGDTVSMRVFTQRKTYEFTLKVLGEEEIEIPLGRVKALHLRHENPADREQVDVWLGVDQHYVPVKMRYPVARNRLMVEQTATDIDEN
ncbi:MAG: DUF3108 domain-containing protein [Bacillota bacterium]